MIIHHDDSTFVYFKVDSSRNWFGNFKNGIKLFENLKSGDMKLEEAIQKVSKTSNPSEMVWRNYKSEHPGSTLKILKWFTKHEKQL